MELLLLLLNSQRGADELPLTLLHGIKKIQNINQLTCKNRLLTIRAVAELTEMTKKVFVTLCTTSL